MSKLFNGLKFILIGATSKQRQMISMNIMNEGGLVLPPSSFPLSDNMRNISTNTNDLLNCTHMLLSEHKRVTSTQLCDFLGCSADELNGGVLEQQSLVNCDWVTECIARRQVVGPDAFRVLVVEDDDMKETNSAETASKVKASVEMDSKKRKINEFFKPTATKVSATSSSTSVSPQKLKLVVPKRSSTSTLPTNSVNEGGLSIGTSIFGQPCHISALDVQSEHSNTPLLTDQSMATTRALALQHKETESTATPQWTEVGSVLFRLQPLLAIYPSRGCSSDSNANSLMEYVGFDMDDTVICTKSGKVFASDEFDWKFWNEKVRPALRRLVLEEDKCVVLLSNQGGVAKGKVSKVQLQRKVEAVIQSLGVPVDFLCALGDDLSRKPLTGMWDLLSQYRMSQLKSSSASVRMSLFVGDAAGRPAVGTKKKDFSDSDLKLALNLNAGFNTPEEFFLSASPRSSHVCLTGTTLGSSAVASSQSAWEARLESVLKPCTETASSSDSSAVEIILLVGPPASGKSTISRLLERRLGYVRINRDKLGTVEKCLKAARQVLIDTANDSSSSGSSSGTRRSIVVDNTNIDIETRAPWLSLAIELNIPIRCIFLETSKDVTKSLLKLRGLSPDTLAEDQRNIPTFVLENMFKKLQPPQLSEGFIRVDVLPFILDTHSDEYKALSAITKRLYECYM